MRTIYAFAVSGPEWLGRDVLALAVNDKGEDVAYHISSSLSFAKNDIGLTSKLKHTHYDSLFPEGWEMVWVDIPGKDPHTKASYARAFNLDQELP